VAGTLPSGWRNVPSAPQRVAFGRDGGPDLAVTYRFAGFGAAGGAGAAGAEVDGEPLPGLVLLSAGPDLVELVVSGIRRDISVHRVGDVFYLDSSLGASALTERPRFPDRAVAAAPGSLLAPMPGTVLRIGAAPGQAVQAGTPVVVLEAMKMEHTVSAPHDGVLAELLVTAGQQVDTGTVLAVVAEAGDPEHSDPEHSEAEERR
jgi:multidrug efflux pump subunit AcrA (membrane-fusion protein)